MEEILRKTLCRLLTILLLIPAAAAQKPLHVKPAAEAVAGLGQGREWTSSGAPPQGGLAYRLGPGDEITVTVLELSELQAQSVRIGTDGIVALPLIGRVQAAGFTVGQFSELLRGHLKEYIVEPHVAINVVEFRSQPVSVLGAVNSPGVHHLQGRKTLIEILSLAGGVRQDAGYQLRVTRRSEYEPIPLDSAVADPSGQYSVAEIPLEDLTEARNPAANIEIKPHDVISVPTGKMVYVIGAVERSGGFVLNERQEMSVLELLALAGGLGGDASKRDAKVLRPKPGSAGREEIAVNLKDVMKSEGADMALYSGDILFVPESGGKKFLKTALTAGLGVGTGVAIWRLARP